jgi:hypothetical protein
LKEDYEYLTEYFNLTDNIFIKLLKEDYKAPNFWNAHIKENTFDVMFYLNDDILVEPNCLKIAIDSIVEKFPDLDGIIGIRQENIPIEQCCLCAFGAIGTKFTDRFPDRKVFCEDYYTFFLDSELYEYANSVNKFYFEDKAKLLHLHPSFSKYEIDKTHIHNRLHLKDDKKTNIIRKEKEFLWGKDFNLIND